MKKEKTSTSTINNLWNVISNTDPCCDNASTLPLPTEEQTAAIVARIAAGDDSARDELINGYVRLARSRACWFINHAKPESITAEDLFGEAYIELCESAYRFNPSNGKFGRYAKTCIDGKLKTFMNKFGYAVHIPEATQREMKRAEKICKLLEAGATVSSADEKWYNETGRFIDAELTKLKHPVRLDINAPTDNDDNWGEQLADANNFAADYEKDDYIAHLLERLDPREKYIILNTFGFAESEGYDANTLAKVLGITPTRVRQIRKQAIEKMRKGA